MDSGAVGRLFGDVLPFNATDIYTSTVAPNGVMQLLIQVVVFVIVL